MLSATFRNRWFNQSTAVIFGILSFLVIAIAWSFWAELDQITRAPGQAIPTGRLQVIQSTDGGQIERIMIREGDHVKQGQIIGKIGMSGRATGPHLHWSMKWNDSRIDPILLTGPMN